jgi:hypothetical protein
MKSIPNTYSLLQLPGSIIIFGHLYYTTVVLTTGLNMPIILFSYMLSTIIPFKSCTGSDIFYLPYGTLLFPEGRVGCLEGGKRRANDKKNHIGKLMFLMLTGFEVCM